MCWVSHVTAIVVNPSSSSSSRSSVASGGLGLVVALPVYGVMDHGCGWRCGLCCGCGWWCGPCGRFRCRGVIVEIQMMHLEFPYGGVGGQVEVVVDVAVCQWWAPVSHCHCRGLVGRRN